MVRKTKDQSIANFAFEDTFKKIDNEREHREEDGKREAEKLAEKQKSRVLNDKDDGYKTTKHISSIGKGGVSQTIEPAKYLKTETSDSIFGSKKVENKIPKKAEEEITKKIEEERKIAKDKESDAKRMTNNPISNKQTTTISLKPQKESYDYKTRTKGLGIFDESDFAQIPEKSDGEKLSAEIKEKKSQKDVSWKNSGKAVSSKNIRKSFINKLF